MFKAQIKSHVLTIEDQNSILFEHSVWDKDESLEIFGVYGSFTFNKHIYLILVQSAERVGLIGGYPVFEVKDVRIFNLKENRANQKGPDRQDAALNVEASATGGMDNDIMDLKEIQYLKKCIAEFFELPGIYFSEAQLYLRKDFNRMLDKIAEKTDKSPSQRLILQEERLYKYEFLFNSFTIDHFNKLYAHQKKESAYERLILKCIQGYFGMYEDLILISRRCPKRAGSRYFSRGVDQSGYPSNFVETEQIVSDKNSYLHLRGSIPLVWKHTVGFVYKPAIKIDGKLAETSSRTAHELLENIYNRPVVYLNLIHKDGYEENLYKKFNQHYGLTCNLYNYDFKKDFRKVDFPINFLETGFNSSGRSQKTIIRTNCIDCLDRTNSMQYFIGRDILRLQLEDAGVTGRENIGRYEEAFKTLFYENGNNLSIQYAGTKAQGSYFITHGQRHILGSLSDCYSSVTRYFINRYRQGQLHNVYEVLTGVRIDGNILGKSRRPQLKMILIVMPVLMCLFFASKTGGLARAVFLAFFLCFVVFCITSMDYPLSYH
ncbi:uncharacterized protein VICG_01292 [Vittaforma corneae ATCC 50505]|uniref:SAC domain-containing protein n=1 Tax=Vittaforma corneae (strain ATCC 50505) TaxID=993615 RepID=L2GM13_VITCO|nr:uncharacterized protein VICG_01292 [Vittaforma corneae ATCC 50505]ELA41659.1 hypothetical protein VICG_01292 [Vittaforma corneae ATCC 50505]